MNIITLDFIEAQLKKYVKSVIESSVLTGYHREGISYCMNANHQFENLKIKHVRHDILIYISTKKNIMSLGQNITRY
jgi:hypothetical protein